MNAQEIIDNLTLIVINYGPRLLGAIVVFIVGWWLVKLLSKWFSSMLARRNVDLSLQPFLAGLVNGLLKVLLVVTVFGMIGIQMTSFIAIIGALGLAVGMALSGTLQNFAGGVIILLFKPFRVGDYIDTGSHSGTVREIQIFNTILKTVDNVTIIIPNGNLSNTSMTNYSVESRRRVDWSIRMAYGDDVEKTKAVIKQLVDADNRILHDPEVFIVISELADHSVKFAVR
ncbi:MAG: mechanosensitive ion channel, partial [Lentimicrobiaceae bacterium]|nr:mechanosensitive ion channel [Lentimicrobiaceae bacterium]